MIADQAAQELASRREPAPVRTPGDAPDGPHVTAERHARLASSLVALSRRPALRRAALNRLIANPGLFAFALRHLTKKYGTYLIIDEVQTGLGRTGTMFAVDHLDVEPDIMTMAKAITNGAQPMGAVAVLLIPYISTPAP